MQSKKWWLSKGVWGGIIGFLAMALQLFGVVDIAVVEQAELTNQALLVVTAIVGLVGSLVAIYGRFKASKKIG